ncbi:MAG: hypothetical protein CML50_11550 [Rhodobacteraceae bacterium]|jgi:hypothetical protein|uniref:hypothetical protein n=2 Tax=Roseobacteraceae TaxID=2854170 RepID=UPI0009754E92|nr:MULTISPECIES: hypothetical protein [Salipiger]MAB06629.1 hypothetical protein [Paracoccaceae bacterium]GGA27114.1 hypothetical protein GCM10011326_44030 [Salipiger profundus]|tara:strand:+ start:1213 stop:1473 length:261 start_codon:yes stop_codon:yes gene_type:complete
MVISSTSPCEFDFDRPEQGAKMANGQAEGERKLRYSFADRGGPPETFAEEEIGSPLAGPETDCVALKLPEDPFGDLDRGQTAGGRV